MPGLMESPVRKIMLMLSANYIYWGKERDDEQLAATIKLYERLLGDIPVEVLEIAALAHIAESRFFPTVSELREKSIDILMPQRKTALEAWSDQNDPIANKVRALLPNYHAREITLKEQGIIKAQFLKYYEQIAERERRELKQLPEVRDMMRRYLDGPRQEMVRGILQEERGNRV